MRQIRHYDTRTFLLCIDSYDNCILAGRFCNPSLGESGTFQSMAQLLMKIEQCLDIQNAPQAFHTQRRFFSEQPVWPESDGQFRPRPGAAATFTLQILFRRNASWQGSLCWLETGQECSFRSALEMIGLINDAMTGGHMHSNILPFPAVRAEADEELMEG